MPIRTAGRRAALPTCWRSTSPTGRASFRAARIWASYRSSIPAAMTSKASTTSGAASRSVPASMRQVAGGPLAENILKCHLKPLDAADYAPVTLTAPQLTRLQAVFPDGVCDWSLPGIGQQAALSPLTFADGPGGHPLPPAPVQGP